MQTRIRHNPVFYHWYATRTCVQSNLKVRSFWDNGRLTVTGGPGTVRNPNDCERHRSRELAWNGMVNRGELLINVVRTSKPKDADRLEPKGTWSGVSDSLVPYRRQGDHRRIGRTFPIHEVSIRNVVSPHASWKGKRPVRVADRRGGMGRWSKRRPLCNEADRGGCLPRKWADFHRVFRDESVWPTD
jgi:hypothetical protein